MLNKSIITVFQFTKSEVLKYIYKAEHIKKYGPYHQYPNKILINMFYEPSTRTSCSFQTAAIKLGCKFISLTDKISSVEKGESLEDTIKTLNCYGDVIVLRHPEKGSSKRAVNVSEIPIINAGDGNGEHPTQALLDIYTIYIELSKFNIDINSEEREYITVTFVGDLKNSRTIHSLIYILSLFPKIKFICVSPKNLELPDEIYEQYTKIITIMTLEDAIPLTDILYVTRIQKERLTSEENYNPIIIDKNILNIAKKSMIVMHPLPRLSEISIDIDDDPRSVYFTQVKNGVYMRMAILDNLFSG
jgi:aspartate carbamoyltransferase